MANQHCAHALSMPTTPTDMHAYQHVGLCKEPASARWLERRPTKGI